MKTMSSYCRYCGKSVEIEPALTTTVAVACYECYNDLADKQAEQEAQP